MSAHPVRIEGPAFAARIGRGIGVEVSQRLEDGGRFRMTLFVEIAAIAAVVGDGPVFIAEPLGDFQHLSRFIVELARRLGLERQQVVGQRHCTLLFLGRGGQDAGALSRDGVGDAINEGLVDNPSLVIDRRVL